MHRIADKILIEEFEVETIIGVYEYERVQNQTLVISMTLHTCFSKVEESDDIEDTLDYTWICDEIKTIATETKSFTLEALGTKLAQWALSLKFVEKVVVKLNKRGAVTNAKSIGIEVVREKEEILKEDTFERSDQYYDNEVNETNEECLLPSDSPSSTKSSDVLCYLALGSNIGRRAWYIEKAIEMLRALVGKVNRIAFLLDRNGQIHREGRRQNAE
ncbi:dihydroneopterin aldolase-like isoform X2 [Schistocerca gregaria]|uniref:dihydroneopterin aldolase-like isoform X2 n=1 Tax=Schistocerca gregaria TaxID=7010 RepID=UPI00211F0FDE|nr:dihydroneopterin aldolase-like isoform X2 [Schistocerca gregaria]